MYYFDLYRITNECTENYSANLVLYTFLLLQNEGVRFECSVCFKNVTPFYEIVRLSYCILGADQIKPIETSSIVNRSM